MMYKKFFWACMCLLSTFAFTACGDDDDDDQPGGGGTTVQLNDNQMLMDGKVVDVHAGLGIRPAGQGWPDDPGAYYIDIFPVDETIEWHGRYDLGLPLIGKTVDLANPAKVVGKQQFSIFFQKDDRDNPFTYFSMEGSEDMNLGMVDNQQVEGSCFSSGTFVTTHDKDGFRNTFSGVLKNGKSVALKIFIPESEIQHWG